MNLSLMLFLIGVLGFVLNRKKCYFNADFYWNHVISYNFPYIGKFT